MPLRILIADDEEPARNELSYQLEQLDDIEIVGQAVDGPQAVALAEALAPDVVLLDIQMPGLTGFAVARQLLERGVECHVVFVTAFDQHAIEAFEVSAVDYLLKPVEPTRLAQTIQRVRRLVPASDEPVANKELERIVQYVTERQSRRARGGDQGWRTLPARPGRGYCVRLVGRRSDYGRDQLGLRHIELSNAR